MSLKMQQTKTRPLTKVVAVVWLALSVAFSATPTYANEPGLTPAFDTPVRTSDGFTVAITNYNQDYTWAATSTTGAVYIDPNGVVTVTGLAPDTASTVTVTTSHSNFLDASADISSRSLRAPRVPLLNISHRTTYGFTVYVQNYTTDYSLTASTTLGSVSVANGGYIVVRDLEPFTEATVTVEITRAGYLPGSAEITSASLYPELTPLFGPVVSFADSYQVEILNYDPAFTWEIFTLTGSASISNEGVLSVTGLGVGESSEVFFRTTRDDYEWGYGQISGAALNYALNPDLGAPVRTPDGFTVQINNYDPAFTWSVTTTMGTGEVSDTGLVTVSGVDPDTRSYATVATTRTGYYSGSSLVYANSLVAALTPTLDAATSLQNSFSVQITNFDPTYTWSATSTAGVADIDDSGLVTVSGLADGQTAQVTVEASRDGYATGSTTSDPIASIRAYAVDSASFGTSAFSVSHGYTTAQTTRTISLTRVGNTGTNPSTTLSVSSGIWEVISVSGTSISGSVLSSGQPVVVTLEAASGSVTIALVSGAALGAHRATLSLPTPQTLTVTVAPLRPTSPRLLKTLLVKKTGATISWSAPLRNGGTASLTYQVKLVVGGKTYTKSTTARTLSVTKLKKKTTYSVTVAACNSAGCSPVASGKIKVK